MFIEYIEGQKFASKGAAISEKSETFKDCGYVLEESDLIVDIDSVEKSLLKKMIDLFNIKTQIVWTDRGCHLYFKKPVGFRGAEAVCALGFKVEYKHIKNCKSITIKRAGKLREIENIGIREDIPSILKYSRKFENLYGLDDGEGRNQALFKHRVQLGSMPEYQSIIRFINFEVFATPLPEHELETIMRNIKVSVEKDNEFELGTFIIDKYKTIKYMGRIYYKYDGKYNCDDEKLLQILFEEFPSVRTSKIDEIFKQVSYRSRLFDDSTTFDIKFNNGILRDGKFIEVQYEEFTPYTIDLDYDPDCPDDPHVMDYLNHLTSGDKDYQNILWEVLGHSFIVNKEFKRALSKFFIFIGGGGNGKGTLLMIIKSILGNKNCSGLSIDEITDERYFTSLKGKLVNLGDDIHDRPINHEQMKKLKNISTCDFISSRELYKSAQMIEITASLIFTSNHVIKSFEKGESYKRRVMWLPMFSEVKKIDPLFITKLTTPEALKCFIKHIVGGYLRLYQNGRFTESKIVNEYNAEYHKENNNVTIFVDDMDVADILNKRSKEIHDEYTIWAEENGLSVCSQKMLNEAIYQQYKVAVKTKRIGGRTAKVYAEA